MQRRYKRALETGSTDDSHYIQPRQPAIVAIAQRLVGAALDGDMSAQTQIQDRIEGKAGLRQDDIDPDDPARKRQTQQLVSEIMAGLTGARIAKAEIVDVEVTVVDKEPGPA
jgi:hypothetical protein